MEMVLKSIKSEFNNGATESVEVEIGGSSIGEGFSNNRVTLKDMDFANMTQNDIEQAARDKMAGWFTETDE